MTKVKKNGSNINKLSGGQLAGGNSTSVKADNDYYATAPETTRLFLERYIKDGGKISGDIWECACGEGHISKVLQEYFPDSTIISSDLIDRGFGKRGIDFLLADKQADTIITNPPFSLMNEFIEQGLKLCRKSMILFGKIQTLEGVERVKILRQSPLQYVYVYSKRQATWKNGMSLDENGRKWATTMCTAWFVWNKSYRGEPVIRWL